MMARMMASMMTIDQDEGQDDGQYNGQDDDQYDGQDDGQDDDEDDDQDDDYHPSALRFRFFQYHTMILQRTRNIVGVVGFEPCTAEKFNNCEYYLE